LFSSLALLFILDHLSTLTPLSAEPFLLYQTTSPPACNAEQAKSIISVRPFEDVEDLRLKFTKKRGISPRLFDNYIEIMQGYHKVDAVLKGCEAVGNQLARAMSAFTGKKGKGKATAETANDGAKNEEVKEEEGALNLVDADIGDVDEEIRNEKDPERKSALKGYIREQPPSLVEGVKLKDYQVRLLVHSIACSWVVGLTDVDSSHVRRCSASTGSTCYGRRSSRVS
jgi:hypothetical protein